MLFDHSLLKARRQHEAGGDIMSNNEFSQIVATDFAPQESICEWCSEPAVQQLTKIGGRYHNVSGFFCQVCGEAFTRLVNRPSDDASEQGQIGLRPPTEEKYGSLPLGQASEKRAERNYDDIPIPLD
jgi:hypothetical protein